MNLKMRELRNLFKPLLGKSAGVFRRLKLLFRLESYYSFRALSESRIRDEQLLQLAPLRTPHPVCVCTSTLPYSICSTWPSTKSFLAYGYGPRSQKNSSRNLTSLIEKKKLTRYCSDIKVIRTESTEEDFRDLKYSSRKGGGILLIPPKAAN